MIQSPTPDDTQSLLSIAVQTGLFKQEEAESLLGGILSEFHDKKLGAGHEVQIYKDESNQKILGWVYFAPSFKSDGVWDLWWIGVNPKFQGKGVGGKLLKFVEEKVKEANGRILIIETSHAEPLETARKVYLKRGYTNCGRIPDYYSDGDDKIIFAKSLS
mgnify:CR=1 FL=1